MMKAGEHEVQLKHLTCRKSWQVWIICLLIFFCLLSIKIGHTDDLIPPQAGISKLKGATATDWISYSPDGTKVAIIHTKQFSESVPFGTSLQIYGVDSSLQLSKLLFEDRDKTLYITEFQWVGDYLIYLTVNTDKPTDAPMMDWLHRIIAEQGREGVDKHVQVKMWPKDLAEVSDLSTFKFSPPGIIFSSQNSDRLLIFDLFHDNRKYWDNETQRFSAEAPGPSIRSFQIPSGKLLTKTFIKLPVPSSRWPFAGKGFVPLFLSPDNSKLIAIHDGAGPTTIISIDLTNGTTSNVSSDKWRDSLHNGSEAQYFSTGNPVPVDDGKQIVCGLSMSDAPADMDFRFVFYDLKGKKLKEVDIFGKDVESSGVPVSLRSLITWTPDGKRCLFQQRRVWLYDWQSKKSTEIADNILVKNVIGWIDKNHLLVQAKFYQKDEGNSPQSKTQELRVKKQWAILSIPEITSK